MLSGRTTIISKCLVWLFPLIAKAKKLDSILFFVVVLLRVTSRTRPTVVEAISSEEFCGTKLARDAIVGGALFPEHTFFCAFAFSDWVSPACIYYSSVGCPTFGEASLWSKNWFIKMLSGRTTCHPMVVLLPTPASKILWNNNTRSNNREIQAKDASGFGLILSHWGQGKEYRPVPEALPIFGNHSNTWSTSLGRKTSAFVQAWHLETSQSRLVIWD